MVREVENNSVPEWVEILLGEKFFTPCSLHISCKKNDKTFFCLFCRSAICFSCFSSHRTHALLQILIKVYKCFISKINFFIIFYKYFQHVHVCFHFDHLYPNNMIFYERKILKFKLCMETIVINQKVNEKIEIISKQKRNYENLPPRTTTETQTPSSVLDRDFSSAAAAVKSVKKKNNRSCVKSLAAVLCRPRCFPISDFATAVNRRKGVPHRSPLN
ncbi:putative PLATZ transcription factor family protein [Cucumis melo var. makuwa]|uniref:PLATZ transcription factor family protein n=1 Tax=Cucumis melo var. makuwa TaxID=1194695 RepID=A0A5A7TEM7_CUCMM|nr:putative PLATZ transcription factor family protein [Cucumis melo var. makuwa]